MGSNWFGSNWFGSNWFGSNWGGGGSSGGPVFAMRADHPIAERPVTRYLAAKFRDRDWDADLTAILIMKEFLATAWEASIVLPPPAAITDAMIDDLLVLSITERPEALGEIVQQHQNFQLCWLQLLNFDQGSHPKTYFLMKLAARVGEYTMISLKRRTPTNVRPRPSQVCPTLYPPVPVPGHAPYPAGHALIAHLTSACLAEVVPAHATSLKELADRVGFNRVIAGLHYREDVTVGADIGGKLHPFLKSCNLYQITLAAAQAEWA